MKFFTKFCVLPICLKFNELQKKSVVKLCWIFHYLFSITYLKSCFHCKWLNSNTGTDNACKNGQQKRNFNKMNDELNKEGTSDSLEDEPASLRVENEVNDDNKVDTSSEEEVVSKKKNKMAINYGIVSSILIISSILTFFVTEEFLITPFVLGVCILGMTWYSVKRKTTDQIFVWSFRKTISKLSKI